MVSGVDRSTRALFKELEFILTAHCSVDTDAKTDGLEIIRELKSEFDYMSEQVDSVKHDDRWVG